MAGFSINRIGQAFTSGGEGLINMLKKVGSEVIRVGSDFDSSRMTLTALYKSSEVAAQKMNWAK
jgi:hypothetical protein